jgi:hypothetical protein
MTTAKRNAFINGIESGSFNNTKAKIYDLLKKRPLTLDELVLYGFKKETASARISDLMDLGLIKSSGNNVSFFEVITDPLEQDLQMKARSQEGYEKWIKRGRDFGYFEKYFNQ